MIIRKLKEVKELLSKKSNKIECAIDEEVVDCDEMDSPPYIGVPAPAYLEDDPWFGPAPERTEKQLDYMEKETHIKQQQYQETHTSVESEDIHQKMYEIATQNTPTTIQLNPPGGSENVWMSGTGMGQFNDQ